MSQMDYLCHFEFCAWKKLVVSQKAEIETIPMFSFINSGKIINIDVPLCHQVSITTQHSFNIPVLSEPLKLRRLKTQTIYIFQEPREPYALPQLYSVS